MKNLSIISALLLFGSLIYLTQPTFALQATPSNAFEACTTLTPSRFYDDQGGDYWLKLGATPAYIIGRKTWGAAPAITQDRIWTAYDRKQPVCSWIQRITVHHTHGLYTPKSLQTFHQNIADPKADIAYHFFIDQEGHIYEGRPLGRMGSHSESDNPYNVGIALNGNFEHNPPSPAQTKALKTLLSALNCACFTQPIWTHGERKRLRFPQNKNKWTTCPGKKLTGIVNSYRKRHPTIQKKQTQPAL